MEEPELKAEDWHMIIKTIFHKKHIFVTILVGGGLTLRPDIIEVFCKEMSNRICVVTSATFPLKRYNGPYFYWVSIDGTENIHDRIRGKGSYAKPKKNVLD